MSDFTDLKINLPSPFPDRTFSLDINTQILSQGVTALFGPSGAGKTTALRALTGLPKQKNLYTRFNQTVLQDQHTYIKPEKRNIIYVSSEKQLFPHLTVQQNWLYAQRRAQTRLNMHKQDNNKISLNPESLANRFGIRHLQSALPQTLSTGEAQKVTLIRAVLSAPRLLLLDEPLGNIDYTEKKKLMTFILEIAECFEIPMLYISHHTDEVRSLAEYVLFMENGHIVNSGSIEAMSEKLISQHQTRPSHGVISLHPTPDIDIKSCTPSEVVSIQPANNTSQCHVTLLSGTHTFTTTVSNSFLKSKMIRTGDTVFFCTI